MLAVLLSTLAGCVLVVQEPVEDDAAGGSEGGAPLPMCGDPDTFSVLQDDDTCVCEPGLVWCSTDIEDLTCCVPDCGDEGALSFVDANGGCQCLDGADWCTDDPDDTTCCPFLCGDEGTFSQVVGEQCECVEGYDWCSDEAHDVTCC